MVAVEVRAWPASVDTQRKTQSQKLETVANLPDNSFTPFEPDAPVPTWEYVVYLNTDKQFVIKPGSDGKSAVRERIDGFRFPGHTKSGTFSDGPQSYKGRQLANLEGDNLIRPAGAPSKGGYFDKIPQSPTVEPTVVGGEPNVVGGDRRGNPMSWRAAHRSSPLSWGASHRRKPMAMHQDQCRNGHVR